VAMAQNSAGRSSRGRRGFFYRGPTYQHSFKCLSLIT
jgi:hypothetical protein